MDEKKTSSDSEALWVVLVVKHAAGQVMSVSSSLTQQSHSDPRTTDMAAGGLRRRCGHFILDHWLSLHSFFVV
ncbi:hypothetical protein ElyMa_002243000, partial [Elysia marginata]